MFIAYVVVTLMTIAACTFVAVANFARLGFVLTTAAKVSVPESWITMLGLLNAASQNESAIRASPQIRATGLRLLSNIPL